MAATIKRIKQTLSTTQGFSLCGCARPTLNPLGSALVRYFNVAAISVPPKNSACCDVVGVVRVAEVSAAAIPLDTSYPHLPRPSLMHNTTPGS